MAYEKPDIYRQADEALAALDVQVKGLNRVAVAVMQLDLVHDGVGDFRCPFSEQVKCIENLAHPSMAHQHSDECPITKARKLILGDRFTGKPHSK